MNANLSFQSNPTATMLNWTRQESASQQKYLCTKTLWKLMNISHLTVTGIPPRAKETEISLNNFLGTA